MTPAVAPARTASRAQTPPSTMTADVDEASTTTPPVSAPSEMVTWNDEVNNTVAASGARGTDLTNHVWEHTGTAP